MSFFTTICLIALCLTAEGQTPTPKPYYGDFKNNPILRLQIFLDQRDFSPNCIDGGWGTKTAVALATYKAVNSIETNFTTFDEEVRHIIGSNTDLFTYKTVTQKDIDALVNIPSDPKSKSALPKMGYQTLLEMYAELGHTSERALKRLNPMLSWPNPKIGSRILLPKVSLSSKKKKQAAALRISLSRCEITAFDTEGNLIALFPCSIAAKKSKLPPPGEIQIVTSFENPDYTYTPDFTPKGTRTKKYIYNPGPNNPVGVAWLGLSLPTYGIHGTPYPERIGRAESHGCFRLANWNALKLHKMCDPGVSVVIEN